jgi:hypothetical protein
MNMVLFNSLIIFLFYFTFSINYIYFVKYCDCIFHESCISLILCTIKLFSRFILNLVVISFSFAKIFGALFKSYLHFKEPKFDHNFFSWDCLWGLQ